MRIGWRLQRRMAYPGWMKTENYVISEEIQGDVSVSTKKQGYLHPHNVLHLSML